MDKSNPLKSLITSTNQHINCPTEQTFIQLQRNLEILIGLTATKPDLDDIDPLCIVDFISALLNILLKCQSKKILIQRVLTLLQNLSQNMTIVELLQLKFHIHLTIAMYLQNYDQTEVYFTQCLKLLNNITYNIKICQMDNHLENLINLLIKHIESENLEIEVSCLCILNNLCRRNHSIQTYIKNMQGVKEIYKVLIGKLKHHCIFTVLNSLSILANLVLDDEIGDKLFSSNNINKTFNLIFNLAISEDLMAKRAAVDLLLDLLTSANMMNNFVNYKYLRPSLQKILDTWLKNKSFGNTVLILKLCLGFMSVTNLKSQICSLICSKDLQNTDFISMLVFWIDKPNTSDASILSIKVLTEVVKQHVIEGNNYVLELLKDCFVHLVQEIHKMHTVKRDFEKLIFIFDLLIEICKVNEYKRHIIQLINLNYLEEMIMNQLHVNPLCIGKDPEECSEVGIDLILSICTFLNDTKDHLNTQEFFKKVIESENITSFISFAIGSDNFKRIYRTIQLAFSSELLCDFIAQTIATNNSIQHQSIQNESLYIQNCFNHHDKNSKFNISQQDTLDNIHELIEKLQNNFDIKDLKSSEIMEMYDYKINSLMMKIQQFQEIIDSKTMSLQKSDNLINQFRYQQTQQEAEALKLRMLLKQSKCQNENTEEQLKIAKQFQNELQDKLMISDQEVKKLQKEMDEQQETLSELLQTLQNKQKSLENLHTEYNSVLEMNAMLQRHTESMKQKQDSLTEQISILVSEKKSVIKQLKEKENTVKDMCQQNQKLQDDLQHKEKAYKDLFAKNNFVTQQLEQTVLNKSRLEEKLHSFEHLCEQHEATIKDSSIKVQILTDELNRHKQITEMIHNLSSVPTNISGNT